MSPNYYQYDFVSPHKLYARVQEEMRSYFATGAVDSLMFPLWTEDCIKKFRKTFLPIKHVALCIENNRAELPADFKSPREVWTTRSIESNPFTTGGSYYYQKDYTLVVEDAPVGVAPCVDTYRIMHKIRGEQTYSYNLSALLKPAHIEKQYCENGCIVNGVDSGPSNVYDIEDGCLITRFKEGIVHMIYYSDGLDDDGYQLIPDDFWMQDYIRKYLIYKLYLQIFNQTTDESFNQVKVKLEMSDHAQSVAFIVAQTESKKQTVDKKIRAINKIRNRFNVYKIR